MSDDKCPTCGRCKTCGQPWPLPGTTFFPLPPNVRPAGQFVPAQPLDPGPYWLEMPQITCGKLDVNCQPPRLDDAYSFTFTPGVFPPEFSKPLPQSVSGDWGLPRLVFRN